MKTLYSRTGPFTERPYYEVKDIETICADELRAVGLYPSKPEPVRIDRFIEKRFGVTARYEDLPEGVLGYTKFGAKGVEAIVVARSLSEEGTQPAERRISATLAHEGGHGLLHAHLFALGTKPKSLFDDADQDMPQILCRSVTGEGPAKNLYSGRWWEFQANQAIGALLLPGDLVEQALAPYFVNQGSLGVKTLDFSRREEAVMALSEIFDVNPVVARIRVDQMYGEEHQLGL